MSNVSTIEEVKSQQSTKEKEPDFGNGRFSQVMHECWSDCQRLLGFSSKQAERVARALGADAGKLDFKMELGIGKLVGKTHDAKISLRTFSKSVKTTLTNSICIAKLCALLQECRSYKLKNSQAVELEKSLMDWVNEKATTEVLGEKAD